VVSDETRSAVYRAFVFASEPMTYLTLIEHAKTEGTPAQEDAPAQHAAAKDGGSADSALGAAVRKTVQGLVGIKWARVLGHGVFEATDLGRRGMGDYLAEATADRASERRRRRFGTGARTWGARRATFAQAVVEGYRNGATIRQLARQTGRSYGFIHRVLTENGVQFRQRGGTRGKGGRRVIDGQARADLAVTLKQRYDNGDSMNDLRHATGYSLHTVRQILTEAGASIRKSGGRKPGKRAGKRRRGHTGKDDAA
jgi:lambda repressor-like predicted transcriptional regulator